MKLFALSLAVFTCGLLLACQPVGSQPTEDEKTLPTEKLTVNSRSPQFAPASLAEMFGTWHIASIADQEVVENSPARIQFAPEGSLNGNASCNRFFGAYRYAKSRLQIPGSLGATKMMCAPAYMEQEQRLLQLLPNAASVSIENQQLVLRDDHGKRLITASRTQE